MATCLHTVFFECSIPSLKVRAAAYEVSAETRGRANQHQPGVVALQAPADGARLPGRSFHTVDPLISTPCSAQALKSEYIAPTNCPALPPLLFFLPQTDISN